MKLTPASILAGALRRIARAAQNLSRPADRVANELRARGQSRRNASNPAAIYVWVPKTAGSSLNAALEAAGSETFLRQEDAAKWFKNRGIVTFGHLSLPELIDARILDADYYRDSWKFAFVRDPYDRAVSLYEYLRQKGWLPKLTTFSIYCAYIDTGAYEPVGIVNHDGLSQLNPQVTWLKDASGELITDFIGRFEQLQEGVSVVMDRLGIPDEHRTLGHENSSVRKTSLASYYGPQEIDIIRRVYREDFDTFGYNDSPSWLDECRKEGPR